MGLILLPLLLLGAILATLDGGSDEDSDDAILTGEGTDTVSGGEGDDPIALQDQAVGYGGEGNDTITGAGSSTAYGSNGDDHIHLSDTATGSGGVGNDQMQAVDASKGYGFEGDDILSASDNATVWGGAGDDWAGATDEAAAHGGLGDDTLYGDEDTAVYGDAGNDTMFAHDSALAYGGSGDDLILMADTTTTDALGDGGSGNDTLTVFGRAQVLGGVGNDLFLADLRAEEGEIGNAMLRMQDFDPTQDQIAVVLGNRDIADLSFTTRFDEAMNATIVEMTEDGPAGETRFASFTLQGIVDFDLNDVILYGNDIGDVLDWTPDPVDANDTLVGDGNDVIAGDAGNDLLTLSDSATGFGGLGNDTLIASDEATAYGREGDDSLTGADNSTIAGGDGNDLLLASGTGEAHGGDGNDVLALSGNIEGFAGAGNDTVTAEDNAIVNGGAGNDLMTGSENAALYGGDGTDWIVASGTDWTNPSGTDFIDASETAETYGGNGNDTLLGGTASGGAGADMFIIPDLHPESDGDVGTILESSPMTITDFDAAQDQLGIIVDDPAGLFGLHVSQTYSAAQDITTIRLRTTAELYPVAEFSLQGQHQIDPDDLLFFADGTLTPVNFNFTCSAANDSFSGSGHPSGSSVASGGAGDDILRLEQGTAYGGAGNDMLTGEDILEGGEGDDLIRMDTRELQGLRDIFIGEAYGGAGNDTILAEWSYDPSSIDSAIDAGAGDDLIQFSRINAVNAGSGDDTAIAMLEGSNASDEITLGTGQDLLAIDLTNESGSSTLVDFNAAEDELGIILPEADRAGSTVSLTTNAQSGFLELRIMTDDVVKTLVLEGITSGVSLSDIQLFADVAAVQAGTSYATL